MHSSLREQYGNRVRVRVCGLLWDHGKLLMVNHKGLADGDFWAPPGGGIEFGEHTENRLQQEFEEETGLVVTVDRFLFTCEFVHGPLHAIELFFEVKLRRGSLKVGDDPELSIITDVKFMSSDEVMAIPKDNRHGIFQLVSTTEDLKTLTGFFRI